jgi:hypothetical protein
MPSRNNVNVIEDPELNSDNLENNVPGNSDLKTAWTITPFGNYKLYDEWFQKYGEPKDVIFKKEPVDIQALLTSTKQLQSLVRAPSVNLKTLMSDSRLTARVAGGKKKPIAKPKKSKAKKPTSSNASQSSKRA